MYELNALLRMSKVWSCGRYCWKTGIFVGGRMQFSTRIMDGVTAWHIMDTELHEECGCAGFGHIFGLSNGIMGKTIVSDRLRNVMCGNIFVLLNIFWLFINPWSIVINISYVPLRSTVYTLQFVQTVYLNILHDSCQNQQLLPYKITTG